MIRKLIAYYRVSTQRQGVSRLGLHGQQSSVTSYTTTAQAELVASYTEVESGRKNSRPELTKAIRHAKALRATLVIAKVDRLAQRRLHRQPYGLGRRVCRVRHAAANRLTLQIMAAVAEAEAVMISERTKAALAAAKARGVKLGSSRDAHPAFLSEHRAKGAAATAARWGAEMGEVYTEALPIARDLASSGLSLRQIGARLDAGGHRTRLGRPWTACQVRRLLGQK